MTEVSELVDVRTASGDWVPAVALSAVEGTHSGGRKVHDFPVVWVTFNLGDGTDQTPWPAEDVRPHRALEDDDQKATAERLRLSFAGPVS